MFSHILLGNIFSFCAAVCVSISVVKKNKTDFIGWQIGDDIFSCLTCLILSSYAAFTVCFVCFIRNIIAYKQKLTCRLTTILFMANIAVGLAVNNLGVIGLLPIVASASYTIFVYLAKTAQHMRYALIFTLLLWIIHCLYIQAYPSALVNFIICTWTILQAIKKANHTSWVSWKKDGVFYSLANIVLNFINKGIITLIRYKKATTENKRYLEQTYK